MSLQQKPMHLLGHHCQKQHHAVLLCLWAGNSEKILGKCGSTKKAVFILKISKRRRKIEMHQLHW